MRKIKRLHSKFTMGAVAVLLVITLCILLMVTVVKGRFSGYLAESHANYVIVSAGYTARNIDGWLMDIRGNVDAMHAILPALPSDSERFAAIDALTRPGRNAYIGFGDGRHHTGWEWERPYWWHPYERAWYVLAMQDMGRAAFVPPYIDAATGELVITISRHMRIDGLDAVFAVDIWINEIVQMVYEAVTIPGSYAMLVDQNGRIIVHTYHAHFAPDIVNNALVATILNEVTHYRQFSHAYGRGESILRVTDYNNEDWYLTAHDVYEAGWRLYLAVPESFFYVDTSESLFRVVLACVLVALVMLLIIRFSIDRMVIKPVSRVANVMKDVAHGKLNTNMDRSSLPNDELGALTLDAYNLVDTIKDMVDDLKNVHKQYIQVGNMSFNVDESKYENSFKEMIGLVNVVLTNVTADISGLVESMNLIGNGDFDTKMDMSAWIGDWNYVPQAVQGLTEGLKSVSTEVNAMIDSVANRGDLSFKIDETKYKGDWGKIVAGLNDIAKSVN